MKTKKHLALSGRPVKKNIIPSQDVKNIVVPASSGKKPSDFFGIFNPKESEKFGKHIQQIRSEWDRNMIDTNVIYPLSDKPLTKSKTPPLGGWGAKKSARAQSR